MEEYYEKWLPRPSLVGTLWVNEIVDGKRGLSVTLSREEGQEMLMIFDNFFAYRNTNEGDRLRLWNDYAESRGLGKHSLYKVRDSEFLSWFHEESVGVHRERPIIHYAILTPEDCIDVLSIGEPSFVE